MNSELLNFGNCVRIITPKNRIPYWSIYRSLSLKNVIPSHLQLRTLMIMYFHIKIQLITLNQNVVTIIIYTCFCIIFWAFTKNSVLPELFSILCE